MKVKVKPLGTGSQVLRGAKSGKYPQKAIYPRNGMSFFVFLCGKLHTVLDTVSAEDYNGKVKNQERKGWIWRGYDVFRGIC